MGGGNHVGLLLYQHSDFSSSQSERSLSQGCFFCPPLLKGFKSPRAFSLVSPSHLYLAPTRECRHKADLFTLITKPRQSVLWLLFHPRTMLFNLKCLLGFAEKECFRRTKKKLRKQSLHNSSAIHVEIFYLFCIYLWHDLLMSDTWRHCRCRAQKEKQFKQLLKWQNVRIYIWLEAKNNYLSLRCILKAWLSSS